MELVEELSDFIGSFGIVDVVGVVATTVNRTANGTHHLPPIPTVLNGFQIVVQNMSSGTDEDPYYMVDKVDISSAQIHIRLAWSSSARAILVRCLPLNTPRLQP